MQRSQSLVYVQYYVVSMLNRQLSLHWENAEHDSRLSLETAPMNTPFAFLSHPENIDKNSPSFAIGHNHK